MHEGVPPDGPLVRAPFARANRLAGNAPTAAAIELSETLEVNARRGTITIADDDRRVVLAEGDRLVLATEGRVRVRYLALAGGIDASLRLGGRGALLVAGIGRPLKLGDRLVALEGEPSSVTDPTP